MKRLPDWEARLHAFLLNRGGACHTYGVTDCCMNAADAVLAMTGEDIAAEFRGRYTTPAGAKRALKRYGAGTIDPTIDSKLPVIGRAFARRGDLVVAADLVAICIGGDAVALGDTINGEAVASGWVRFPRSAWTKAWKVG